MANPATKSTAEQTNKCEGTPLGPADPLRANSDTLQAMDDAISGRNLIGPFETVDEIMASLEED
ncbi:hypothetical protein [Collinsella tanakaei]|uniref:hypothetical protein n=1 Tax=Collinsella tanakaei TaxID=626935 RepID=UPI0039F45FDE